VHVFVILTSRVPSRRLSAVRSFALYALGFVVLPLLAAIMLGAVIVDPSNPVPGVALGVILAALSVVCGRAWYRSNDNLRLRRGDLNRAMWAASLCFAIPLALSAFVAWLSKRPFTPP
jgi:hypothetical protein